MAVNMEKQFTSQPIELAVEIRHVIPYHQLTKYDRGDRHAGISKGRTTKSQKLYLESHKMNYRRSPELTFT
jgi:hypothetical protein